MTEVFTKTFTEIRVIPREGESYEDAVKRMYPEEFEQWGKALLPRAEIEHSLQKRFRYETTSKFTKALKEYQMLNPGDKVGIAISGGKDSLLLAKLFQALEKFSDFPVSAEYISMDPGFDPENRKLLEFNCAWLGIPLKIFTSDVFDVANTAAKNPCYLCARMRRGHLYSAAKQLGCNKTALGHHFNDVIETTMLNVLWSGNYKVMMPKIVSRNFSGMELIRPLYLVEEKNIIRWRDFSGLQAMDCACTVTKREEGSKRKSIKALIAALKETNPNVEQSIFKSGENVAVDAIPGYIRDGKKHSFLELYGKDDWVI